MFLGHLVHLKAKARGDNSMPEKREPLEDAEGAVPQGPRDRAKEGTRVLGRRSLHSSPRWGKPATWRRATGGLTTETSRCARRLATWGPVPAGEPPVPACRPARARARRRCSTDDGMRPLSFYPLSVATGERFGRHGQIHQEQTEVGPVAERVKGVIVAVDKVAAVSHRDGLVQQVHRRVGLAPRLGGR
jgi:hypothetical protein